MDLFYLKYLKKIKFQKMYKRFISILVLVFFISSCGGAWQDVKRGVTGQKRQSADEFLIQKKDPLVLPPDFEKKTR